MPRALLRLLALALGALVALGLSELGLRALDSEPVFRVWTPGLEAVFEPQAQRMPGIAGPSRFRISSLGFRADERPAAPELSILALGGSTTECLYLDQAEAWPALLQEQLGARLARPVWVANAGRSGRTTRDHALQLHHLLAQEPRFERVLLSSGVNDLCAWLAGGGARAEERLDLTRAFDVLPRALAPGPWWKRTALWQLARGLEQRRLGASALAQDPAGLVYETWRAHRRGARRWLVELPDARAARADFRAELARLAETCEQRSVELVLVTQPALWRAELAPELEALLWMGGVGDFQRHAPSDYYTAAALAQGLALFNAELESFAAERGLLLLDLARALEGDARNFYDDVHFNEEGARAAATFLCEGLATH